MALDFMTGFEGIANAAVPTGIFSAAAAPSINSFTPRTGSRCLSLVSTSSVSRISLSNAGTRIAGFGLRLADITVTSSRVLFAFGDGNPTTAGNCQVGMIYNADGSFSFYTGRALATATGGTLIGTTPGTGLLPASDTYYFIELEVTFAGGGAGSIRAWVEGVQVANLTGVTTISTANAYANAIGLGGYSSAVSCLFDDVYVLSTTGGSRTTRFGNFKVAGVVASSGNGSNTGFTPSAGTDRGAMVDDATSDGDSTYNASAVVGSIDTYNFAALGVTAGQVVGLQVLNYARSDAGSAGIRDVARIGGVNYFGTPKMLASSYSHVAPRIEELSLATGVDWTVAEIDAAEFGLEHNS